MLIEKIEDFKPEFIKQYNMSGYEFMIEVQYRGVFIDDADCETAYHYWAFKLWVGEELIVAGPFRHNVAKHELTKEAVADNLAGFYSCNLDGLIERSREEQAKTRGLGKIEEIVELCKDYYLKNLYQGLGDPASTNIEVVATEWREDGWRVILKSPPGQRLYEFVMSYPKDKINISTYVKAYNQNILHF